MKRKLTFFMILLLTLSFAISCLSACEKDRVLSELQLNVNQVELRVGENATISVVNGQAGEKYTFYSNNECVSVDKNGKMTANSVGAACITVNGKTGFATCTVIVSNEREVELISLSVENKIQNIQVGQTYQLTCVKEPFDANAYNSIRWSSDNEEVASVTRDGLLTANKPGEANLTVTATGTQKSATFKVTVTARTSTLSLIYNDVTAIVGVNDLTLSATLFTDYSDVTVEGYNSSNTSVATVNQDGEVNFIAEGKAVISYAVTCGGERLEATCKVAVVKKDGYKVIRTPEQLQEIANNSGNYMLGNDIDLSEACAEGGSLYYAGMGFSPLFNKKAEAFSGTFDGMGYSIKNLYINRPEAHFVALFGYINVNEGSEGVICNLALEGGKIEGANYVSSFIAYHNGSGSAIAGLKNCWTNIEIVAHGKSCGGLVSYNGGMIENCYSLSKISGSGTLCSISYNTVEDSTIGANGVYVCKDYQSNVEELVKQDNIHGTILNAYYKSLDEMKNSALYQGWDTSVWNIADGYLPTLKSANER